MTTSPPRKLFLLRHGERIDFTFGDWIPSCFDETGKYTRTDLNMPLTLPRRTDGHSAYLHDSPLTRIGVFQATTTGEALEDDLTHAYCSPAFRCVQTCDAFLRGCKKRDEIKIKIEPGLFEWLQWYSDGLPKFISPEELAKEGFNIDLDYKPLVKLQDLDVSKESVDKYYSRSYSVTKNALGGHNGNVLLVGHSATLDVCSRKLLGKKERPFLDFASCLSKVPYCGFLQLELKGKKWEIGTQQSLGLTHARNTVIDKKTLLE